jgi:PD-(D/E)XK endonuclease
MAPLKQKGDLAELRVAADLRERGCAISVPFGEDTDYDLIADFDGQLHRVQVKYTTSDKRVIIVRCRSDSLTNGRVRRTKRYTAAMIDWIAVFDSTTDCCYYVPAAELGAGRVMLHLRLLPALNGQRVGIRFADDYSSFPVHERTLSLEDELDMEPAGLEPATSALQTPRSSN